MTVRATSLVATAVAILALSTAISLASSGPFGIAAGHRAAAAYCPADAGSAQRRAGSTPVRIALHCRCCGKDENGHCNHQCCTD